MYAVGGVGWLVLVEFYTKHHLFRRGKKMKKKQIFIIKIIIACIFFVFCVPIGIDWAYKLGCHRFITNWNATDVLAFYGTILGGAATLLAVYLTIQDGNKKREKDRKIREDEEIYPLILDILFEYLDSLDGSYFIRWLDGFDKGVEIAPGYSKLTLGQQKRSYLIPTDKLLEMIERVNSCDRLEIKFPPYKEDFFKDALTKLREYRKEYTPLLLSMNSGIDLSGLEVADVFKEIRKLHSEKYDDMVASVHDCLKKFKQRQI